MTTRDLTAAEGRAIAGMVEGDLGPLADLFEAEGASVHPLIQRNILYLIRGTKAQSDYRIEIGKRPDLADIRNGNVAQDRKQLEQVEIASKMAAHGQYKYRRNGIDIDDDWQWMNSYDAAVASVIEEFAKNSRKVGKTKVTDSWKAQRDFIAFGIRAGYRGD